ncbi:RNA-binding S4 domain protein [Methylobacterium aquaticum]|uniref:RNA-binding S4 domain protein n=1 Tax=Methylobacterium aquaticum TaxID=270351 RepID=A0A0C6FFE9_9HYPH|nr:RNA-binding S4 domain protein [Methylobacterium aquaticum]
MQPRPIDSRCGRPEAGEHGHEPDAPRPGGRAPARPRRGAARRGPARRSGGPRPDGARRRRHRRPRHRQRHRPAGAQARRHHPGRGRADRRDGRRDDRAARRRDRPELSRRHVGGGQPHPVRGARLVPARSARGGALGGGGARLLLAARRRPSGRGAGASTGPARGRVRRRAGPRDEGRCRHRAVPAGGRHPGAGHRLRSRRGGATDLRRARARGRDREARPRHRPAGVAAHRGPPRPPDPGRPGGLRRRAAGLARRPRRGRSVRGARQPRRRAAPAQPRRAGLDGAMVRPARRRRTGAAADRGPGPAGRTRPAAAAAARFRAAPAGLAPPPRPCRHLRRGLDGDPRAAAAGGFFRGLPPDRPGRPDLSGGAARRRAGRGRGPAPRRSLRLPPAAGPPGGPHPHRHGAHAGAAAPRRGDPRRQRAQRRADLQRRRGVQRARPRGRGLDRDGAADGGGGAVSGLTSNETVKINDLTLCHKHSAIGFVRATLPDVCRSPVAPVPYANVAYARDLENGTVTVRSHGGAMNGVKGSRFYPSYDDEPGTGGGVTSGVNRHEATWLSWSPNVFMEGRPVTRLTDKMLMNRGNTVSVGGYQTRKPVGKEVYICEIACPRYVKK